MKEDSGQIEEKRKFSIVIADDDLDDHDFIKLAIKEANTTFEVLSVYDGLQLMDLLLKRESYKKRQGRIPDLIFLDLNMPLMDGFGVLTEMKNTAELSEIPVFVLSTSRSKDDNRKAIALGAKGFYTKAASFEELKKIVDQACSGCL